jgi:NADPH-dependent 7-cyano-7-deazaguanine reductase QueF-like protein
MKKYDVSEMKRKTFELYLNTFERSVVENKLEKIMETL